MITIYNFPQGARGVRVAWQCEEMSLAYRAVAFEYPVPSSYRAKYALGSVPFLEDDDDVAIGESVAQMIYLANRYGPSPLLPSQPAAQARVLQLIVASEATLGGLMNPMMGTKFVAPADQKDNWTEDFCRARVNEALRYLESQLSSQDYFIGNGLTLADIAISTALGMWQGALGQDVPSGLAAHLKRMQERATYQRAADAFHVE